MELRAVFFLPFVALLGLPEGSRHPVQPTPSSLPTEIGRSVPRRTAQEVLEFIDKAGTTKPDWWADTPLEYPDTLDLSWPKAEGPWNTRKNVGQYVWSIINENPRRWKQGTKFLHYVLLYNRENQEARTRAIEALGHCYHDLLEDWARAAYWLRKLERQNVHHVVSLANSYLKLGSSELAARELRRIPADTTRYGSVIKLWSDMGEIDKALALARVSSVGRYRAGAYMGAGDACRKHGRLEEAREFYEKVIDLPSPAREDAILERNKSRARIQLEMLRLAAARDLRRIPDGSYEGSSLAYNGDLSVRVEVKGARIQSVEVLDHSDKQYYSALTDVPLQIVQRQSLDDVDATTGATITAEAIVNAAARALSRAIE